MFGGARGCGRVSSASGLRNAIFIAGIAGLASDGGTGAYNTVDSPKPGSGPLLREGVHDEDSGSGLHSIWL